MCMHVLCVSVCHSFFGVSFCFLPIRNTGKSNALHRKELTLKTFHDKTKQNIQISSFIFSLSQLFVCIFTLNCDYFPLWWCFFVHIWISPPLCSTLKSTLKIRCNFCFISLLFLFVESIYKWILFCPQFFSIFGSFNFCRH